MAPDAWWTTPRCGAFRARFALLRRADRLSDADQARLEALFEHHPRRAVGWQALQELYRPYTAGDHAAALAALDRFTTLYATGEIPEFHDVVDTIIAWGEEILAFHDPAASRASNGRLEGTNKLQVLRRVARGFTCPPQSTEQYRPLRRSIPKPTRLKNTGKVHREVRPDRK